MRRPTVDDIRLARLFLLALVAASGYCLYFARPLETFSLVPCPCYQLTEVPCPGCGMTRACISLVRGDLAEAWHYHPFSFVVVALAAGVAVLPTRLQSGWRHLPVWIRNAVVATTFVLVVGHWMSRLGS